MQDKEINALLDTGAEKIKVVSKQRKDTKT